MKIGDELSCEECGATWRLVSNDGMTSDDYEWTLIKEAAAARRRKAEKEAEERQG